MEVILLSMCGRFAMDDRVNEMIVEFVAVGGDSNAWKPDWRPSYNIRPTDQVPILLETLADRHDPDSATLRRAELAQWWLAPSFAKELKSRHPMFNARSETAAELVSFRASVKNKRAIVPVSGYYESKTEGKTKTPHFIHAPEGLLYFAGLYSWWADPTKETDDPSRWHLTTTILTRESVGEVAAIHDRTPVTLPVEAIETWIDPRTTGDQSLVDAMVDAATGVAETLEFHEIRSPITGDALEMTQPV